jgi:hypothetical protein
MHQKQLKRNYCAEKGIKNKDNYDNGLTESDLHLVRLDPISFFTFLVKNMLPDKTVSYREACKLIESGDYGIHEYNRTYGREGRAEFTPVAIHRWMKENNVC